MITLRLHIFCEIMKYLISLIILGNFIFGYAQKPVVTKDFNLSVGPKHKRIRALNKYHFAFGSQILSLKKIKNSFIFYRSSLRDLTKSAKSYKLLDSGDFVGTLQLKDTVLLYFRQKNKLISKKIRISAQQPVDTQTVINSTIDIAKDFGFSSRFGYDAGNRINAFAIKKSVDESKYVIVYAHKKKTTIEDKNTKRIINIKVYNQDQSLDWEKSLPLPYYYKKMNADDFAVDSKGNFYVLASVFTKDRVRLGKRNKEDTNFTLQLFKTNKENDAWDIKSIETSKSIEDAVIYSNAVKEPIIVGFYADKEVKGIVTGAFTAPINQEKIITPILHPIPTDTIKAYKERKETQIKEKLRSKRDKEDLEDLHINQVITNSDGSFNLFAEQRYTLRNSYYVNGVTTVNYEYYYKNAYATKIDGKGNLQWFNQLPKNQFGKIGKQAMSYKTMQFGNYSYVLVWDKYSNLYKSIGDATEFVDYSRNEYYFMATYKINNLNGEVKKLPVLNSLEVDKYRLRSFDMEKSMLINPSNIIFEGYDGRGKNYFFQLNLQ